jgi:N-acetylmuramoyl-L-alanine amidase
LNLQVAQFLGQILAQKGYRVVFTRDDDRFIPLQGRVDIAEQVNASVFVSIHHNASENTETDGLQTYYIRDNSRALARIVHRNLISRVGQPDRGLRTARYYVIRKTTMPAILVEMGYMTNSAELAIVSQAPHQRLAAESIARALDEYFRK